MGFLSGLMGAKKTTTPATGFFSMPKEYQDLYNNVLTNTASQVGNTTADMFRPMDITGDEQAGLDMFRKGFTPNEKTLGRDISMLMNPFDDFVINDVNREANSANSILKSGISSAGQMGSNRQMLGANDIEQTRLGTIGKLRQGQYNTTIDTIFNKLVPQRQQDAVGMLGIGDFMRELDSRQKLAPLQANAAQTGMLGSVPTTFGDFGAPSQTIKTGGGLGGFLGGLSSIGSLASGAGGLATAAGAGGLGGALSSLGPLLAFSDRRLKENIKRVGEKNGFPLYEFNYIDESITYVGVMADDVKKIMPEAVGHHSGYDVVDYSMIGVPLQKKEANHGDV